MIFGLFKNILLGRSLSSGITDSLSLLAVFALLGWLVGALTEALIRQSLEVDFRRKIENHRSRAKADPAKSG
jgi:hypothetical protein